MGNPFTGLQSKPIEQCNVPRRTYFRLEATRPRRTRFSIGELPGVGLGEFVVCNNSDYILQGDAILDRTVYRVTSKDGEGRIFKSTTLSDMLQEDSVEDIYWMPLEWRHLQSEVDESGGQACRFELLASILNRLEQAGMDSETFIPSGHQFTDSDFVGCHIGIPRRFPVVRSGKRDDLLLIEGHNS